MSKLDIFHSQIVALYITSRSDFYNFIKTCSKNKDAALSLKINIFPMIFGDELRFPNIETQYIKDDADNENLLIYPNKKIKYINTDIRLNSKYLENENENEINLNGDKFKNIKICHIYNSCNDLLINSTLQDDQFNLLIHLKISRCFMDKDKLQNIKLNLPFLKTLIITYCNNANITLSTPSLKYLDIKYFKSVKIIYHDLIVFHTYEPKNIECNFHYPFYYNGEKCENVNQYMSLSKFRHKLEFFNTKILNECMLNYCKLNSTAQNRMDFINMVIHMNTLINYWFQFH